MVYRFRVTSLAIRNKPLIIDSWLWALFMVICKFPELLGLLKYICQANKLQYKLGKYK